MVEIFNPCTGCQKNCCERFKISSQLLDGAKYSQVMRNNPQFKVVDKEAVLLKGKEVVINLHDCDWFDKVNASCLNYEDRPILCKEAGVRHRPHKKCLIYAES